MEEVFFKHGDINQSKGRHSCPVSGYRVNSSRNPEKHWIPPYSVVGSNRQVWGRLSQAQNDKLYVYKNYGCLE